MKKFLIVLTLRYTINSEPYTCYKISQDNNRRIKIWPMKSLVYYYMSKELNQSNTKILIRTVVDLLCTT